MKLEIDKTLAVLKSGGVIVYPTDTVWGLGCDATNAVAVDKIYAIKGRQQNKSLIVLLDDVDKLQEYVIEVPAVAWDLLEQVDVPLTIVYPGGKNLAPNVLAADGSVAIRIVKEEFCRNLIRRLNNPLISTSANISGDPPPLTFRKISHAILEQVDYAVDWNRNTMNSASPSSIIKLGLDGQIELLR
ncbi:MAG: L-threonylcarbamoyladenylate synthase [Bacteroidota bacterium]